MNSDKQGIKDLPQIIEVVTQSKDGFKNEQHNGKGKKSYIFGCVAGSVAIAYFIGLTSI